MKKKICTVCKTKKSLDEFYDLKQGVYGKKSECKECTIKSQLEYYAKNKQKCNEARIDWQRRNRERYNEYTSNYREKNRERINEIARESYKRRQKEIA